MKYFWIGSFVCCFIIFESILQCSQGKVSQGDIPCSPRCKELGKCVDNKCLCDTEFCSLDVKSTFRSFNGFKNCSNCPEHSTCNENSKECDCDSGYVRSLSTNVCLEEQNKFDGECLENKQCKIEHSECINGTCQCASGYTKINETCSRKGFVGQTCSKAEDCENIQNTECNDKKCECIESMVSVANRSKCIVKPTKPGDICDSNKMCNFIKPLVCLNQVCQCPKNQHLNKEQTDCIADKNLGDPCEKDECYLYDEEHKQNSLMCKTNCTCADGYKLVTKDQNIEVCEYSGAPYLYSCSIIFTLFMYIIILVIS